MGIKKVHYKGMPVKLILLCGLFNPMISQIVETTSTTYAPTSQISMYNSLMPVIMLIFSALINHEYPTRRQLLFVLVTVVGVFITTLADKSESGLTALGFILIIGTMALEDPGTYRELCQTFPGRIGVSLDAVMQANELAVGTCAPDLTLIFDIDPALAAERTASRTQDRMEAKGAAYQQRVAEGFRAIAAAEPARVKLIDAARDVDTIHAEVMTAVQAVLPRD